MVPTKQSFSTAPTHSSFTAPTYTPFGPSAVPTTPSPSTAPSTVAFLLVVFLSSIPGMVYVVVGITALQLRRAKSDLLNSINALYLEVLDLLIRGFFLTVLITQAVINYGTGDITSFVFFLLSRLWIVLMWIMFASKLFQRISGQPSRTYTSHHHRSKMIKYEVLSGKFRVTVFSMVAVSGLLELSILRLLPWLSTEFSKYMGYPNLFTLRYCLYGSNISLVLQCIASILMLTQGSQSSADRALSIISAGLSIFLMLKTFMETVFAIQKESSDKIVTVLEMDKRLLRSVSMQAASKESLARNLDEIATLRFSDSEILWKSDNPLQVSITNDDPGPNIDKTIIALEGVKEVEPPGSAAGADGSVCVFAGHVPERPRKQEGSLMDMVRRRNASQLDGGDLRIAVYNGQLPLFQFVHRSMDLVRAAGGEA
eukprot:gene34908-45175_t